jgi:hypothetical protein
VDKVTYQFKKAIRSNTSVLIALAGPSGGGKTMSGMKLAKGLAGDGKWVVLDTEAGRSTHYASMFDFDVLDMKPPFSPQAYYEAIVAAEDAGYSVIFIDSATHEWSGDGGCTDIHDEALERMSKGDPARAERMSALAWRDAKMQHKRFMSRLLQCRAHLIFGLRAEDKIKFSKVNEGGRERTVIEHIGFQPICEKSFMFEMSASFLLTPDAPGVPKPIKLPEILKGCFPLDRPIDEESGRRLAAWAAGATDKPDTAAIEQAFKAIGWQSDAIDQTVGKPIAEWTPADVNIARQAYRKATAQKAATI